MEFSAIFFVFVIAAVVIGLIVWGINHQKKVRENWSMFAQKYGLQTTGGTRPQISGWFDGVHIQLNTVIRGSGKNRSTYTQYNATINAPMPNGLTLTKEGFFSKVGKMFGGQDVQVGDPLIDDAFIIKARDVSGTMSLLRNDHLRQALLYCISRHPGMRISERHMRIEQSGMTGKLEKIEGVFQDLCYLAKTIDAAYQELTGGQAESLEDLPDLRETPPSPAAAKILDTGGASSHDEGEKLAAMAQMAGLFEALGDKLEDDGVNEASGIGQSNALSDYDPRDSLLGDVETTSWMGELSGQESDAFANPDVGGDAFASPGLLDESDVDTGGKELAGAKALNDYDPTHSLEDAPESASDVDVREMGFESAAAEDAFASPDLLDESDDKPKPAPEAETGTTFGSFDEVVAALSDSSLNSSARDNLIEEHDEMSWEIEFEVDRVESSFGFDMPDRLRDGKTIEGHFGDGKKLLLRFPKEKNDEIKDVRRGHSMKAWGKLAAWDDLFKKPTLDAQ